MFVDNPIPVTRPYLPSFDKYQALVADIYKRNWLTNKGPFLQELESRLASYLGVKHLICVANGTLALQVAYKALDLKGSVVTTPFSFIATASSLKWEGLTPVFADINPKTFNLCPENAEHSLNGSVSAILPVHVFGNPCEVNRFEDLGKKYGLPVIYDASHAFSVKKNDGTSVLNFGNISTLSFHSTKLFHTIEGGAIITDDDGLAEKIRLIINFGIDGPDSVAALGINAKMNEFQAGMGILILDEFEALLQERLDIYNCYVKSLSGHFELQERPSDWTLNGSYMPILLNDEMEALALKEKLKENGIFTRRYFYPSLDNLNFLNKSGCRCNNSLGLAKRILSLPIYNGLQKRNVHKIASLILRSRN